MKPLLSIELQVLREGLIEVTVPDKPQSRLQKYRLTDRGSVVLAQLANATSGAKVFR